MIAKTLPNTNIFQAVISQTLPKKTSLRQLLPKDCQWITFLRQLLPKECRTKTSLSGDVEITVVFQHHLPIDSWLPHIVMPTLSNLIIHTHMLYQKERNYIYSFLSSILILDHATFSDSLPKYQNMCKITIIVSSEVLVDTQVFMTSLHIADNMVT